MIIDLNTAELEPREAEGLILLLATVSPGAFERAYTKFYASAPLIRDDDEPITFIAPKREEAAYDPAAFFGDAPLADASTTAPAPAGAPGEATDTAGVETDSDGLPWDERIHSSNHKKSQNGKWMQRRGVLASVLTSVTGELKARPTETASAQSAAPPPPTSVSATPASPASPEPSASIPPPPAPPLDAGALPPPPPPPAEGPSFPAIMRKVTEAQTAGKFTTVEATSVLAGLGLATMRDLATRTDLIPAFEAQLDAYVTAAA